jgi:GR25 family glycosyltransferase involved in LPS biosynthesis
MTLDSRSDRRSEIKKEFERLEIPITWWIVKRHPLGGNYGCFETHVNIWEHCDTDIVIIFEDDFKFNGTKSEFNSILNEAIELSNKYDTVHLGTFPYRVDRQITKNFYEGKFLTASCYVFRKEKITLLIPMAKNYYGCQPDLVLTQISRQAGLLPCRIFQDFTDSNNGWMDRVPIISKFPSIEKGIRAKMTNDPYFLMKFPAYCVELNLKFMIGLNCFQQILPRILFNTGIEYTDRR